MADLSAKVDEALETHYLEFFENSFAKLERREWDLLWETAIETALNKDWLSLHKHSCRIEIKRCPNCYALTLIRYMLDVKKKGCVDWHSCQDLKFQIENKIKQKK